MLIPGLTWIPSGRGCGEQPIQGPGCDTGGTEPKLGEVHSPPLGMGSVHKSVDGSLYLTIVNDFASFFVKYNLAPCFA